MEGAGNVGDLPIAYFYPSTAVTLWDLVLAGSVWMLPVGVPAGSDEDVVDAVARQVPGLELGVHADEDLGAVVEGESEGTVVADLDCGDGFHEQVEGGGEFGAAAGFELVPFAGGVAQEE